MTVKPTKGFAPVPARAMGDQRLSAIHFRALLAIASHDRLSNHRVSGKQGQGAWASHETLAKECGVNYANLSVAIKELREWGYVEQEHSQDDKRRRIYRIVYEALPLDKPNGLPEHNVTPPSDSLSIAYPKSAAEPEIVCPEADDPPEIVCPPNPKAQQNQYDGSDNIFRRNGKDITENRQKNSVETARFAPLRVTVMGGLDDNIGGMLASLERIILRGDYNRDGVINMLNDALSHIPEDDRKLTGWADRLLAMVDT